MNPQRLTAQNLGRFPTLDVTFTDGCVAITGPNGAGKSTLLNAIELCLFADGSRDLAPAVGPLAPDVEIMLEFEHGGQEYRVRRSYRVGAGGRGSATLDLELLDVIEFAATDDVEGDIYTSLNRASAAETQAFLEDLLGLSRATFRASSFLKQGDSAAFPESSPAERKALLGAMLDPRAFWPALAQRARDDAKALDVDLAVATGKIAEREQLAATLPALQEAQATNAEIRHLAQHATEAAEEALEAALAAMHANAAAAERHRAAVDAEQQALAEADRAHEVHRVAQAAADRLPGARGRLAELAVVVDSIPMLEQAEAKHREERTAALDAERNYQERKRAADTQAQVVRQAQLDLENKQARLAVTEAEIRRVETSEQEERCSKCEQILGAEAKAATLRSLRSQVGTDSDLVLSASQLVAEEQRKLDGRMAALAATPVPAPTLGIYDDRPLQAARAAIAEHSALTVTIQAHEKEAERLPELAAYAAEAERRRALRADEKRHAAEATQDDAELQLAATDARAILTQRRSALDAANAVVTRGEEQITRAARAAIEMTTHRGELLAMQGRIDVLKLAERCFGRDGVPVLLAENVIPHLESDANRILELMPTEGGETLSLTLRTQRAQKTTEHLRETLDIVVADSDGDRPYETFSGGELARLNLALRLAFARLLAHRRGAESRLLAIDELEYLDAAGQEALVEVVRSVASDFDKVLVVSHAPTVRDAFDATIEIVKSDGVSRVAVRDRVAA